MRISVYFVSLLLVGLSLSCEEIKSNLYNNKEISGTVYLNDTFMDTPVTVASEATIYLSTTTSTNTYLYSTKADKDGKFTLTHQPAGGTLYLIGQLKNTDGLVFETALLLTEFSTDKKLLLSPQYPRGKIKIKTVDEAQQPIFKADVYLFVSDAQAESIDDKTPDGSIRSMTTNEAGTAFFYNLEEGTYYIAGKKNDRIARSSAIHVSSSNVNSFTVTQSKTLTLSAPAQLTVTVKDTDSNPVFGANVHVFSSLTQANSLTTSSPSSITASITDKNGVTTFGGLNTSSSYFVDAKSTFVVSGTAVLKTSIRGPVSATVSRPVSLTL